MRSTSTDLRMRWGGVIASVAALAAGAAAQDAAKAADPARRTLVVGIGVVERGELVSVDAARPDAGKTWRGRVLYWTLHGRRLGTVAEVRVALSGWFAAAAAPQQLWIAPREHVTYGEVAQVVAAASDAGFRDIRFFSGRSPDQAYQVAEIPLPACIACGTWRRPLSRRRTGGRTHYVCGEGCRAKVDADPAPHSASLDAALVALQRPSYPLASCPVDNQPLGSARYELVLDDVMILLCSEKCTTAARANASQAVAGARKAAHEAQKDAYPFTTCLVGGAPLDPKATIDLMLGTTLVRVCSDECTAEFQNDPWPYLAKLRAHAARKREQAAPARRGERGGS